MLNILLFLGSCLLISGFAWFSLSQGKQVLTCWIIILSLLSNFFVLKQITLLGLNTTASEAFTIGGLLGLNLLQEKFGWEATQKAIQANVGCLLFFALVSMIHLAYAPSIYDQAQAAYVYLLTPAPRLIFASLFTFFVVQQFDSRAYRWVRRTAPQLSTLVVSAMVMCCSQLIDTLLFVFLGLWGMVSAIDEIILVTYTVKLIAITIITTLSFTTRRFVLRESHAA